MEALLAPPSALLLHFCLLAVYQFTLKGFTNGNFDAYASKACKLDAGRCMLDLIKEDIALMRTPLDTISN